MNIIPLTLFISLGLTLLFIGFFVRELNRRDFRSAESDSLLPLAEEKPRSNHSRDGCELRATESRSR